MIAAAAFLLMNASKDVSSYSVFEDVKDGNRSKIVGELALDKDIVYNPDVDDDRFSFYLIDNDGVTEKVILTQAKPQDFERAESIVVTGSWKKDHFLADEILMKCPSKYKDEEISLKAEVQ